MILLVLVFKFVFCFCICMCRICVCICVVFAFACMIVIVIISFVFLLGVCICARCCVCGYDCVVFAFLLCLHLSIASLFGDCDGIQVCMHLHLHHEVDTVADAVYTGDPSWVPSWSTLMRKQWSKKWSRSSHPSHWDRRHVRSRRQWKKFAIPNTVSWSCNSCGAVSNFLSSPLPISAVFCCQMSQVRARAAWLAATDLPASIRFLTANFVIARDHQERGKH